ncbi:unnamed protein product [Rotaria sp. Silwood1]|nr:unnamed protein product [Rotaria sp. Silwood1]
MGNLSERFYDAIIFAIEELDDLLVTVSKRNLTIDVEVGSDQEDEGQWLIQGSKQVNHRNRNKGKNETSNTNNQPLSNNYNVVSKQLSNSNTSSSINNNELHIETTTPLINDLISSIEKVCCLFNACFHQLSLDV